MKNLLVALGLVGLGAVMAACGGAREDAPASGATEALDIALSQPAEPRMGENAFEVRVLQGSQPVTDAEVTVELFMAAMPAMNMAEMRNTVTLMHDGEGRYRGTGNVMMAGSWDATVMVMRGGQHLGEHKVPVVAR